LIDIILWVTTGVAVVGTILNARQNKYGFVLWIISNISFIICNIVLEIYSQSFLFFIYTIISVYGLITWSKKEKNRFLYK
jgi:nicotinamide riboside transporter PnuC